MNDSMKKLAFIAIALLSLVAVIVYIIVRTLLLAYSGYSPLEKTFAVILLAGELFILVHGFGYGANLLNTLVRKSKEPRRVKLTTEPSVAILVASRHEPRDVLERTFLTINNINYANKQVYFLDDSTEERYKFEAEELCEGCGLTLYRRTVRRGAKAGIVNDCLKALDQKYVAIFDADQNPMPDFLSSVIPIMEADPKLAFVQTPQFYSNIRSSAVARGAAFQQAVFYEYICEGKNTNDSMFCCGTNVVFRREALLSVGGLDESTVTEDFATSIKLHQKGWRSLYYNHVSAFGMGPIDLGGYFKQQFRWATGTITVMKKVLRGLLFRPFSLSLSQWWEYLLSSTYYLVGVAYFCMMVFPIIYLLLGIPSFFARAEIYFLAFVPYIVLSMSVFYAVLRSRNYRIRDLFLGQLLGEVTFPVYMRAALSSLIGVKIVFDVTEKGKVKALPYRVLWPQLSLALVAFIAVVWGLNRFYYERNSAILVNSFWTFYHFMMLSSILYFNQESR